MNPQTVSNWNAERIAELIALYPTQTAKEIARAFGCTRATIKNLINRLRGQGYQIPTKENTGCFLKGQKAHNKGTNGLYNVGGNRTSFKVGQMPKNHVQVGTIVTTKHKGYNYMKLKIAEPKKWQLYHRYIWEQHHEKIAPKHIIKFCDGNTLNCNIENLYLCSQENNMKQNAIHNYPEELKEVIRLQTKVKKIIKQKTNPKK